MPMLRFCATCHYGQAATVLPYSAFPPDAAVQQQNSNTFMVPQYNIVFILYLSTHAEFGYTPCQGTNDAFNAISHL